MSLEHTFESTYRGDFEWPYPIKMSARPSQPPMVTSKDSSYYMDRPLAGICHCDQHSYDGQLQQYEQLAKKEMRLCQELFKLNRQMTKLSNEVLENPCDDDDTKMVTIYQIDYNKRGEKIVAYRPIKAEIDAPPCDVLKPKFIAIGNGYRDPCAFRYSAFIRPTLGKDGPVTFITTPNSIEAYLQDVTPRTTYQDSISKEGLSILKSQQQYKQPMPSSRRRVADPCL